MHDSAEFLHKCPKIFCQDCSSTKKVNGKDMKVDGHKLKKVSHDSKLPVIFTVGGSHC